MTGFLFAAILLVTVACWMKLRDEGLRPFAIGFLAAAPFLLFTTVAILAFVTAPAGEYRVALEGVEVDLAADGGAVTVGGGAEGDETDDLIVTDLPPRYLTFRADGAAVAATLPEMLEMEAENPAYAAVRVDENKPFANSVALPAGASMVIEGFGATAPAIPSRRQEITDRISVPIYRNLDAETEMYPLRFWARPEDSEDVVTGTGGAPVGSFLSYGGGFFRRTQYVTLVGDGTTAGSTRYEPRVAVIEQGKPRSFALYRLDYSDPRVKDNPRSRAQERRSFQASFEQGRLRLVFDTPDYVRLAPKEIEPLVKEGAFLLATRDPRRDVPVVADHMVLSFPQLGPRVQNELFSVIRVSESGDCRIRVTSHTGTRCYESGDAFRIGERAAAILRLTKIGIPWGIIATLFVLGGVSLLWLRRHEGDRVALIIISAAEVLLAVRLLIAFEGALLDPAAAPGLWESLIAFALLPFTLRVASELRTLRQSVFSWIVECAVIAAVVAIALVRANAEMAAIVVACIAVVVAPVVIGWLAWRLIDWAAQQRWTMTRIVVVAVIVVAIRTIMVFGPGWKERISLWGADLAVTILYLPLVFVFFAMLWQKYRDFAQDDDAKLTGRGIGAALAAAAMGIVLTIVMPAVAKDFGSALVHTPAIVLLFALPLLARPHRLAWALATPLVLVFFVHSAVFFSPHLRGQDRADPVYQKALTDEKEANDFMARRLGQTTNQLRVLSQVAPHQLEEAGTSKAEGLVMQRRVLDRYGGTGLFGAGYLHVPLTTFRDTHMNDNLSAIHILAPFGIAGAIGILALLLALALLPLRVRFDVDEEPARAIDQRGALGILALWTFSLCGIYMVAANLGLVLFTGKNVYLLAATSNSDAIEGGVLLLMALIAFAQPKKEERA